MKLAIRPATAWWLLAVASIALAAWIAIDTLRTIVPNISTLPWFDDWSTLDTFFSWKNGSISFFQALTKQVNEHRIVFPRFFFFVDEMFLGGQGRLAVVASFLTQALHAVFFITILQREGPKHPGQWIVGGVIVAMMFTLRQSENFSSGFQLQFVAVFAISSLSFGLFAACLKAEQEAQPIATPLVGCLLAAGVAAFTMANGLLTTYILAVLAICSRRRWHFVLFLLAFSGLVSLLYYIGYQNIGHSNILSLVLSDPLPLMGYVAAYLGSIASTRPEPAAILGSIGVVLAFVACIRVVRSGSDRPHNFALLGVIVFCALSACLTALGRNQYGLAQAVTGRYATPSAVFWSAQLTYWWTDPPHGAQARKLCRPVIPIVALALALALMGEQPSSKPALREQSFRLSDAINLLALGLDDDAVVGRVAWDHDLVRWLLPLMKENHLSMFGLSDVNAIGRPINDRGTLTSPDRCSGRIMSIAAAPSLGRGGLRVTGRALEGTRAIRRVLIVNDKDDVVGLASSLIPGHPRDDWTGYAVSSDSSRLTAIAVLSDGTLCRLR